MKYKRKELYGFFLFLFTCFERKYKGRKNRGNEPLRFSPVDLNAIYTHTKREREREREIETKKERKGS